MRAGLVVLALLGACGDPEAGLGDAAPDAGPPDASPLLQPPDPTGYLPAVVPAGFRLRDLGLHQSPDGTTAEIAVDFAADVLAVTFVVVGHAGSVVSLVAATAPSGTVFVTDVAPPEAGLSERVYFGGFEALAMSPNSVTPRAHAAAAQIPNTPRLSFESGPWTIRAGAFAPAPDPHDGTPVPVDEVLHLYALERTVAVPASGTIDLALYFTGGGGVTADVARGDTGVQGALAEIGTVYAQVGIAVGETSYHDVPDPSLHTLVLDGPACLFGADLDRLLALGGVDPGRLNLFFIDRFSCVRLGTDYGPNLAGIANGIPGLPLAERDGVVIATLLREDYPAEWSLVVAHELAHFFALGHTRELGVAVYDNIADTPDDAAAADYLMYGQPTATLLSADQGAVMRSSPWVSVD